MLIWGWFHYSVIIRAYQQTTTLAGFLPDIHHSKNPCIFYLSWKTKLLLKSIIYWRANMNSQGCTLLHPSEVIKGHKAYAPSFLIASKHKPCLSREWLPRMKYHFVKEMFHFTLGRHLYRREPCSTRCSHFRPVTQKLQPSGFHLRTSIQLLHLSLVMLLYPQPLSMVKPALTYLPESGLLEYSDRAGAYSFNLSRKPQVWNFVIYHYLTGRFAVFLGLSRSFSKKMLLSWT